MEFKITPDTVPETAAQFEELEALFEEIDNLRDGIIDTFNNSPAHAMLSGLMGNHGTSLQMKIVWRDAKVVIKLNSGGTTAPQITGVSDET